MEKQLYILGAGRHPRTKLLRAQRGHQRRTFYIGELHVQSGKRLPVSVEWASRYFNTIVKHIKDGTVLMHYGLDKFVDPEELHALCFGTAEEKAEYDAEVAALTGDPANPPDPHDDVDTDEANPLDTEVQTIADAGAGEPSLGPSAEDLANVQDRSDEPVDPPLEPEVELPREQETPAAEEPAVELPPEPEVAPEAAQDAPAAPETTEPPVEAPVADTTPEMAPPAPEPEPEPEPMVEAAPVEAAPAPAVELPDGWEKQSKQGLLVLAEKLGLDVSSMPSNRALVSMIKQATKGA